MLLKCHENALISSFKPMLDFLLINGVILLRLKLKHITLLLLFGNEFVEQLFLFIFQLGLSKKGINYIS